MRQTAARLNRGWLTLIGLLLLLGGLAVTAVGTGLLASLARGVGLTLERPAPADPLVGAGATSAIAMSWVAILLAVVGIAIALLGLAWLIAQIPRVNAAKPFRLHDDAAGGLTRCAPSVLTDAVEAQTKALPDVTDASAVLRGTLAQPELTMKVTVSDRADIPQLLNTLQNKVAADVGEALDTTLRRLAVQVEIGTSRAKTHQIVR